MQIQIQEEYKYKYKKIQRKHEHLIYNLQVVAHQQLRYLRWARGNQYNTNITRIAKAALHKLPPSATIRKEINKVGIVFVFMIVFVICICIYTVCCRCLGAHSVQRPIFHCNSSEVNRCKKNAVMSDPSPRDNVFWRVHTDKFINRFWQIHVIT